MKILRTIGILALVAGLVLGGVGSALAEQPDDVPRGGGPHSPAGKRGLSGNVTSLGAFTDGVEYIISLETKHWGTVNITANLTTKYMVPWWTHGSANLTTFIDIVDEDEDGDLDELVGRRLAVLVTNLVEVDGVFTADAIRLMLIPSPDAPPFQMHHRHAHRVGVVEDFTPGSIEIIDKDGVSHIFTLNGTVYRPDTIAGLTGTDLEDAIAGGCVTVVTKGDPKKAGLVAKAIVLHEEMPDWSPL